VALGGIFLDADWRLAVECAYPFGGLGTCAKDSLVKTARGRIGFLMALGLVFMGLGACTSGGGPAAGALALAPTAAPAGAGVASRPVSATGPVQADLHSACVRAYAKVYCTEESSYEMEYDRGRTARRNAAFRDALTGIFKQHPEASSDPQAQRLLLVVSDNVQCYAELGDAKYPYTPYQHKVIDYLWRTQLEFDGIIYGWSVDHFLPGLYRVGERD
jgi:hypothetical protein